MIHQCNDLLLLSGECSEHYILFRNAPVQQTSSSGFADAEVSQKQDDAMMSMQDAVIERYYKERHVQNALSWTLFES